MKSKKYKIIHRSAPAFLYEDNSYDPRETGKGLLRGHFLVRVCFLSLFYTDCILTEIYKVFRHIFTGPSSARAEPGRKSRATRAGNASIIGVTEVTAEMIAYACFHVSLSVFFHFFFLLSSEPLAFL